MFVLTLRTCMPLFQPSFSSVAFRFAPNDRLAPRADAFPASKVLGAARKSLAHRVKLSNTVEAMKPKLLVLDPFVRLHSGDENVVAEVAPVLDFLRGLQRRFGCSVLLVHHARKNAGALRGGQALRGSSELFAWTDASLSLRRKGDELLLGAEHRSAPGLDELPVALAADGDALALRVVERKTAADAPGETTTAAPPLTDLIVGALRESSKPMTPRRLRDACRVRMARVYDALGELAGTGRVLRDGARYRPAAPDSQLPLPIRHRQMREAVAGSAGNHRKEPS
jgi:hypothetical protein